MLTLVTHEHCLDGATCGVLGLAAGMTPAFVYPDAVEAYLAPLPEDQAVVLADVSLSLEAYRRYLPRIVALIDHHQSAQGLAGEPRAIIDLRFCASTLLYRWLVGTGRLTDSTRWRPLLSAVNAYDLWLPDHAEGQDLNRLFHALGWDWYRAKYQDGYQPLTAEERERLAAIRLEEAAFVARHVARADRFQAAGYALAVVALDSEGAVNEVAQTLLEDGLAGVILLKPDGRLSARTTNQIDAARLMERGFQGGGHPRAAGGRLPADRPADPVRWIKEQVAAVLSRSDR
jgi:oligoribonuclease NrnB/cAMP/cGMP phosphodiesterase (DHH superfamily)